jgi:hypothetical protein
MPYHNLDKSLAYINVGEVATREVNAQISVACVVEGLAQIEQTLLKEFRVNDVFGLFDSTVFVRSGH